MAEEHNWEEPNNLNLCANNCGFFGTPTTLNLCSKCYKFNQQHLSPPIFSLPQTSTSSPATAPVTVSTHTVLDELVEEVVVGSHPKKNRCGSCSRRVGLTGFTCRCGTMFCGTHRYPEHHACTFDFKTVGKEAIAKANPVIKGVKLEKI